MTYLQKHPTTKQQYKTTRSAAQDHLFDRTTRDIAPVPQRKSATPRMTVTQKNKHTIPGRRPPSAIPSSARTAAKLPKLRTNPRHMVIMPQTAVSAGSHIFGEAFLMIRLLGTSLITTRVSDRAKGASSYNEPNDIEEVKNRQTNIILVIRDVEIIFKTEKTSDTTKAKATPPSSTRTLTLQTPSTPTPSQSQKAKEVKGSPSSSRVYYPAKKRD